MPDHNSPLADLLAATARGEVEAFAAFYDASSGRVFGLTLKILGDIATAEEAALDACVRLAQRLALRPEQGRRAAVDADSGALEGHRPAPLQDAA